MSPLGSRIDTVCRMTKAKNLRRSSGGSIFKHLSTWCDDCSRYTRTTVDHAPYCVVREGWGE